LFADIQDLYKTQLRKLMNVIHLAQLYYVEDINWDVAIEGAISGMLEKMDPHSVYIPQEKVRKNKENFSGKYEGVGIKFDILEDNITVISPIQGSPSERVGILPGDRIVKIDGKTALGLDTDEILKRLRGPRGSKVKLTIIRADDDLIEFTVERDVIPIRTVTTSFKTDDSTGYILVNRFAATTSTEVEEALVNLGEKKIKRLILDLRNNPGGYLHEAVKVAGKFIGGHQSIVYTQDRSGKIDEEYYSDTRVQPLRQR
jgi:carboxyl-terminal processing protease